MAVLVEGISVIIRKDSIQSKYKGGWESFLLDIPNATMCHDDETVRVGFMSPQSVGQFIETLESNGLTFFDNESIDLAVVDQQQGPTTECNWLEFGRLPIEDENMVSACWLFEGERIGSGMHFKGTSFSLVTPPGWKFEGSLSHKFTFVPNEDLDDQ